MHTVQFWATCEKSSLSYEGNTPCARRLTYFCEAAMSAVAIIKIMYRNHLRVAKDVRIAYNNINPRFDELVSKG